MKLRPCGYMVLVKPHYENKTDWGFQIVEPDRVGVAAVQEGTIVKVGPTAWKSYDDGQPWAKVGDVVYYAKYGGSIVEDKEDGEKYVLIADGDIRCVIEEK